MCRDSEAAENLGDALAATKPGEPAMSMAGARYRGASSTRPAKVWLWFLGAGHALDIKA